ncbi:hypothetical protein Dgeo_0866 [Deinococcus geothermalis DSM 11300]|uniref:Uncharacterized protein n=2 Tax=Deinococcaceae TaxID=183710 RepID=Q1J016_DEIGD|nr:hypothetical protein Dgeo_0866 [Deinococcus geothermalis DSM 11300]
MMTKAFTAPAPQTQIAPDLYLRSVLIAAEAVLAHLHPRAPLRFVCVALDGGVTFAAQPHPQALAMNRGLLEDVVLVALGRVAAARLLAVVPPPNEGGRDARALLASALTQPEEAEVQEAYLAVLEARARATLRRHWAEVEVVAAGLREHGTLDAQATAHRISCAQGIRRTLLN